MSFGPTTLRGSGHPGQHPSSIRTAVSSERKENAQDLGREALEEGRCALVLEELAHDRHAADLGLKVLVLDARLDDVERLRDGNGRDLSREAREEGQPQSRRQVNEGGSGRATHRARDRGDKVLVPRRAAVVLETKDVLLRERRATKELRADGQIGSARRLTRDARAEVERQSTHSERAGRVARGGPRRAAVEREALVADDLDKAARAECLRVGPAERDGGQRSSGWPRQAGNEECVTH